MTFTDLHRPTTARQRLVEAEGSPFAASETTRPLVALMDGRRTNADLSADEWVRALTTAAGEVALFFELPADHEWWLACDANQTCHRWTTYPSGPWSHQECSPGRLRFHIEMIDEDRDDGETGIYRSRVVCIEDAPGFVQEAIRDD